MSRDTQAKPQQTEKEFQAAVVEYARLNGWLCYHTFDSRRSEPGFPDLCLVRNNWLIFAELKAEKGRVSAAQRRWLKALDAAGIDVFIWWPSDWDKIERVLRRG